MLVERQKYLIITVVQKGHGTPTFFFLVVLWVTRAKISQAITGLLAQQPCNNTVNMLERDWQNNSIVQSCFNILYTAWRVDRGCSRMIEYAKPDLIRQPVHEIVVTSLHLSYH